MDYKNYDFAGAWMLYEESLQTELEQCEDEGKDVSSLRPLIEAVSKMPKGINKHKAGQAIFEMMETLPQRENYPFTEPSDLGTIKAYRPADPKVYTAPLKDAALANKLYGAWLGRICGCLLGKPCEGLYRDTIKELLQKENNYPLSHYMGTDRAIVQACGLDTNRCWAFHNLGYMPPDDDTNYTVMAAMRIISRFGREFTPEDVANTWLDSQPISAYCTAERVAYINFVNSIAPPQSAVYQNPYREWIGAQIRGDYFGYINPGDPEKASEMAWRDASVSHVKNGIYGEMFIAAAISVAAVTTDPEEILTAGLSQIPKTSRLSRDIHLVMDFKKQGKTQEECFAEIHKLWNEKLSHHWCHTNSNAMIVAASLLYSDMDYSKAICMAVQAGFDTDCNGATVGSIIGMALGKEAIDHVWTDAIHDTVDTTITGCGMYRIAQLVDTTLSHLE